MKGSDFMEKVVPAIMKQKKLNVSEAQLLLADAMSELIDAKNGTSCLSVTEVMEQELGLSDEYSQDILDGLSRVLKEKE